MKRGITKQEARTLFLCIAGSFIMIHIIMFFLFRYCGVTPMIRFNIFSIAFYLFTLWLLQKYRLYESVLLTYFEVVLHMCLSIYYTGWGHGFEITLIGMNILLFFSEYIGRMLDSRYIHAAPLCLVGLTAYIAAFIIDRGHTAQYPLPDNISFILQIAWAVVVFAINITILEVFVLATFHSEKYLYRKAGQDELTGLLNRLSANPRVEELIKSPDCEKNWAAIIDIDDFKHINDTYGHNYGDYVLSTLADMMRSSFGADSCFRWGGEEFLILGTNCQDKTKAYEALEQFCRTVEKYPFEYEGVKIHLTITCGIAFYRTGMDQAEWIKRADVRLYEGKRSGKNKVVIS